MFWAGSSNVYHFILEENQGYGGNQPTACQGSSNLRKAGKQLAVLVLTTCWYKWKWYKLILLQVVSDDGKKVRRAQPFTERHKEELQVCIYRKF
jgi:La-related protein 7